MQIDNRAISWGLSAIATAALASTWFVMNSRLDSLNAQLQTKQTELTELRGKYDRLLVESISKLDDANKRYNDLVTDANQKLQYASLPEAEVQVGFRKALLNSGDVVRLKSLSPRSIAVSVAIERPSTTASRTYELTMDPNQVKEIGAVEGWAFVPGDTVIVSQAGHKPINFRAP